jgi:hypothetical protein
MVTKRKRRYFGRARARVRSYRQKPTIPISLGIPLITSALIEPSAGWNTPLYWTQAVLSGQTQYAKNLGDCLLNGWLFVKNGKLDLSGGQYTKMMILGAAIHWLAGKAGVNRALGRAKIPYVRI